MTWRRDEYGQEYDDSKSANHYILAGMGWGSLATIIVCLVIGLLIPW